MLALIDAGASLDPAPDWNPLVPGIAKAGTVAATMIDAGADIQAPHKGGVTPLHASVATRYTVPILPRLIELGADLDAVDAKGRTALHDACRKGSISGIRRLIAAGASLIARDNRGREPWAFLKTAHKHRFSKLFSEKAPTLKGLTCASRGAPAGQCRSCNWSGEYARRCPWCRKQSLWGPDREIRHGNPLTPTRDAEIDFHFGCNHCGLRFQSLGWPRDGALELWGRAAGDGYQWRTGDDGKSWRIVA